VKNHHFPQRGADRSSTPSSAWSDVAPDQEPVRIQLIGLKKSNVNPGMAKNMIKQLLEQVTALA
jgi:hypothetical protein